MPGNTTPIFSKAALASWGSVATANTAKDGTGTVVTVFTSDLTNGSFLQKINVRSLGTNVASVMRVFLNNGSVNTTAINNTLIAELSLPATTVSEVASLSGYEVPINTALPAGYKINVTVGTTIAAGIAVTAFGGAY